MEGGTLERPAYRRVIVVHELPSCSSCTRRDALYRTRTDGDLCFACWAEAGRVWLEPTDALLVLTAEAEAGPFGGPGR